MCTGSTSSICSRKFFEHCDIPVSSFTPLVKQIKLFDIGYGFLIANNGIFAAQRPSRVLISGAEGITTLE